MGEQVYHNPVEGNSFSETNLAGQLPNYQLEQLELVEHLTVQVQHPDASQFHARPGRQAKIQAILQGTLSNGDAAFQFRTRNRWKSIFPIEHRVPPSSWRVPVARYQSSLDLGAGQSWIPVSPIQRRRFPVEIFLGNGRAPRTHRVEKRWTHWSFLWFWNLYPYSLRLRARRGHARHPDFHLRALLAGPFRTHPGTRSGEQRWRRVTPLKFVVQDETVDCAPTNIVALASSDSQITVVLSMFHRCSLGLCCVSTVIGNNERTILLPFSVAPRDLCRSKSESRKHSHDCRSTERKCTNGASARATIHLEFLENHGRRYFHRTEKNINSRTNDGKRRGRSNVLLACKKRS